jgi:hypothetical protein
MGDAKDEQDGVVVDNDHIEDASNLNYSQNPLSAAKHHEALMTIVSLCSYH